MAADRRRDRRVPVPVRRAATPSPGRPTLLLEDVARRGRSQGIHLVLASQDVSGIEAFWGRPAIFEQFVLRIALPRARRVLAELNDAALGLPRWHAVVNHESGHHARQRDRADPGRHRQGLGGRGAAACCTRRTPRAGPSRGCSTAAASPRLADLLAALPAARRARRAARARAVHRRGGQRGRGARCRTHRDATSGCSPPAGGRRCGCSARPPRSLAGQYPDGRARRGDRPADRRGDSARGAARRAVRPAPGSASRPCGWTASAPASRRWRRR